MQPLQSIPTDQILAIVVDELAFAVRQSLDARLTPLVQAEGAPLYKRLLMEKGRSEALVVSDTAPEGVPWGSLRASYTYQYRARV